MLSARSLCLSIIAFALGSLSAQTISVTPERTNAVYQPDEIIRWQITVTDAGNLRNPQYTIKPGGLTAITTGALTLTNGQATVQTTSSQPGWFLLEVNGTNAANTAVQAFGGALVAPDRITPAITRPDDFDAFWKSKLDALAAVPINPVVTPGTSDRTGVDYSTVMLDGINGSHVQGQLARPTAGAKFPALLIVQWAGVYSLQKSWATSRAAEGWLVLNTQAHDITPVASDSYYLDLSNGSLKDYWRQGNEDRETSYFLRMYLACHRAAEYLTTRPDWDGRTLVVMGASQGGLQALVTAAIHPKVTAAIAEVPAGSDQAGLDVGRVPGWPVWAWQAWDRDLTKVKNASRYYDVTNFAPLVHCPVLIGVGLIDTTVPPPGVYATYNLLSSARQIVSMPLADHGNNHTPFYPVQDAWLTDAKTARQPTISVQPQPTSAAVGNPAMLSVTATNGQVFGYQWLKNGTAISGATQARFSIATVSASDAADYTVVVTTPGGSITSSVVRLAVEPTPTYTWKNVVIQGGGFVSGILFHPSTQNLIYARTDVGGVYRWEQTSSVWTPLNDDLGMNDSQLTGVVSFAVDPTDNQRLYLATGQYLQSWGRNAAILRSTDQGKTWARTELAIKLGGNADGRGTGERLQVDPNKPSNLLLGTNQNGLWKSSDSGVTWAQVSAFSPTSVTFVLFDKRSGSAGSDTQTIYVGVNGTGNTLYRSLDGGATWTLVSGAPTGSIPNHADFDSDGMLYVSYADNVGPNGMTTGAVWKYNTTTTAWTNISPRTPTGADTFGWGAVSVSKTNAGTLVATTNDRWTQGDEIWRSTDGGTTWTNLNPVDTYDATGTPWALSHGSATSFRPHWTCDVDIDPFNNNRVLFVTGGGIWGTDTAFGLIPAWTFRNNGLEETVPLELVSPPSGAPLLSALGDIGGFRHDNLDASPPEANFYNPINSTNVGLDFAQSLPANIVRTNNGSTRGNYSTNGGTTWTAFTTCPATAISNGPGEIAINADATRIVWIPDNSAPYYSTNTGATWIACTGAPTGSFHPVADRINPNKFYLYDDGAGRVYVSTNGGQSFSAAATVPTYGSTMRAVFGLEGNLWLPALTHGLFRSTDSGTSFTAVSTVQEAYLVGFGKAASAQTHPAILIWGKVSGTEGFFRSDDLAATWTHINDATHQFGWINSIVGDPRLYGRVYLATGGRGIIYGSLPSGTNNPPEVTIASPAPGANSTAGSTITIQATATDTNGTVSSVAFYRGATLIGTTTSSPFSINWTNPAVGAYILTAVATDNDGATTTSQPVNIIVAADNPPAPTPTPTPPSPPASSGGGGGGGGATSTWFTGALVAIFLLRSQSNHPQLWLRRFTGASK